ncbi:M24 family metallopeptidase [Peristeroidobacter soli]|uniref:M24 family metallopeptidase n=1 Tax=Peristeroidobacter soli TaxID=2497877 RepID=UPI00101DC1EB|nr:Xaa-Pro peptidase family protein [Peristeroidobacter soli]
MSIGGSTIAAELAALKVDFAAPPPISRDERLQRLERARRLTRDAGADAAIINAGASLRYFAGVPWGASERLVAMILPVNGKPVMICPTFESGSLEAVLEIEADVRLWEEDENPFALVASTLRDVQANVVAIDPALPYEMVVRLGAAAPTLKKQDGSSVVNGCRMYKSAAELALMQYAKNLTLEVHRRAARVLAPGISTADVRRFIEDAHRKLGTAGNTFCIVHFAEATSYPHGLPGEQQLRENDIVLIDTGTAVHGYNSDITRTYIFGKATEEQRRIWDLEHEAQATAFAAAQLGAECQAVDAAARGFLTRAGLGPDYKLPGLPHRTGHGIGLSIHEPAYLVRGDRTPLAPGMCFSNEPMIVIPGKFGVRLEDHFYMSEQGPKWFTQPQASIDAPFGR